MINVAKNVLHFSDLYCDGAINIDMSMEYDVMFSNSVFSYFPGLRYAEEVLGRCLKIARHGIGLIDIHDPGKERDFIATRKSAIANYETLYKNLPKLFYKKSFFWDFAGKHNLDIVFMREDLNGYWNREFVFDVFLYEK